MVKQFVKDDDTYTFTYDEETRTNTCTGESGKLDRVTYDALGRVIRMEYPHGWVEEYAMGQLLKVTGSDPSGKDMKQQKHVYQYDDCGNMTYEYMRGNGTGEATVEDDYACDALHRVVRAEEHYGHEVREYTYDSLGNLTYEANSNNYQVDCVLNNLNQIVRSSDDGWKTQTSYTYDGRGNLVEKVYGKNKKVTTVAEYIFDETNKMVLGYNSYGRVARTPTTAWVHW